MNPVDGRITASLQLVLKILGSLLVIIGIVVFAFGQVRLADTLRWLSYVTFIAWNVTYYVWWRNWEHVSRTERDKVKPKTADSHFRILESVNQFSAAGIMAVSILLPTDAAIIGFFYEKKPTGGLLEAAFYLTVSLAVAMWNLSRLPTMAHQEETNIAYNRWTAYFQMLQLSTLMLGIVRLLVALFTAGAG